MKGDFNATQSFGDALNQVSGCNDVRESFDLSTVEVKIGAYKDCDKRSDYCRCPVRKQTGQIAQLHCGERWIEEHLLEILLRIAYLVISLRF